MKKEILIAKEYVKKFILPDKPKIVF